MKIDVDCPFCEAEFEAEEWTSGNCPGCGEGYGWDEF